MLSKKLSRQAAVARLGGLAAPIVVCVMLSACASPDQSIDQELQAATANIKGKIAPLPALKPYTPFNYDVGSMPDPFGQVKAMLAAKAGEKGSIAEPDVKRERGALEAFPLEAMRFNGTIVQRGAVHALVTAEGSLYTVRLGEYVGQNYGRIVKISEDQVDLVEKVQDPSGVWVERNSSLTLQGQ